MRIYAKKQYRTKHFIKLPVGCFSRVIDGGHYEQFCDRVDLYTDYIGKEPCPSYDIPLDDSYPDVTAGIEGYRLDKVNEEIGVNQYEMMTVTLIVDGADPADVVITTSRLIYRMVINRTMIGNSEINEMCTHDEGFEACNDLIF